MVTENIKGMTIDQIAAAVKAGTLTRLHTALTRGYVSRRSEGTVQPYAGRFGKGFAVYTPNWDSTGYCFVTYYVTA